MKTIIQFLFRQLFATIQFISPLIAARWAIRLFTSPFKSARPTREHEYVRDAKQSKVLVDRSEYTIPGEKYYKLYTWGQGPAVLLVHGWAGRGSQVAAMAMPLVRAGYRVITFDAFAHGDSPGKRVNILDMELIMNDIAAEIGEFAAVIGHSFGGVAAGYAISRGLKTRAMITIGSPAKIEVVLSEFARQINANRRTIAKLISYMKTRTDSELEDFSLMHLVRKFSIPGLVIHDQDDREVDASQAQLIGDNWDNAKMLITEGLGHRRILRDSETITSVIQFIQGVTQTSLVV